MCWIGNVREIHERRAVGRRVGARCDDEQRRIFVTIRIARGAQDTWEKVLVGTLRGASFGAANVVWQQSWRTVAGQERMLDVATRYDLVELSLVDNPSNPDALGFSFVRDAVPDVALLDRREDEESAAEDRENAETYERTRRRSNPGGRRAPIEEAKATRGRADATGSVRTVTAQPDAGEGMDRATNRLKRAQ
jgi:hypothetical protein